MSRVDSRLSVPASPPSSGCACPQSGAGVLEQMSRFSTIAVNQGLGFFCGVWLALHWFIVVYQVFVFLVCYCLAALIGNSRPFLVYCICACLLVFELLASPAPLLCL